MKKTITAIDRALEKFSAALSFCASLIIMVVMVVVVADVICKKLFNAPITWVMEIVKMSIPIIAFFMIPWATYEFRHVRSTILYGRFPLIGRIVIDVAAYGLGALLFLLLLYGTWPELVTAVATGEFEGEGALRIVTWPTRLLIFISSAVTVWQMVRCVVMSILDPKEEVPIE